MVSFNDVVVDPEGAMVVAAASILDFSFPISPLPPLVPKALAPVCAKCSPLDPVVVPVRPKDSFDGDASCDDEEVFLSDMFDVCECVNSRKWRVD